MILCELHKGERSVTTLQEAVGLGRSALSEHLAQLREQGLVENRCDKSRGLTTVHRDSR